MSILSDKTCPRFRIEVSRKHPAPFGRRTLVATVMTGPHKGETFEATVHDSGQGSAQFIAKMKAHWPKAYTA